MSGSRVSAGALFILLPLAVQWNWTLTLPCSSPIDFLSLRSHDDGVWTPSTTGLGEILSGFRVEEEGMQRKSVRIGGSPAGTTFFLERLGLGSRVENVDQDILLIERLPVVAGQLEGKTRGEAGAGALPFGLVPERHHFLQTHLRELLSPALIRIPARVVVNLQFLMGARPAPAPSGPGKVSRS